MLFLVSYPSAAQILSDEFGDLVILEAVPDAVAGYNYEVVHVVINRNLNDFRKRHYSLFLTLCYIPVRPGAPAWVLPCVDRFVFPIADRSRYSYLTLNSSFLNVSTSFKNSLFFHVWLVIVAELYDFVLSVIVWAEDGSGITGVGAIKIVLGYQNDACSTSLVLWYCLNLIFFDWVQLRHHSWWIDVLCLQLKLFEFLLAFFTQKHVIYFDEGLFQSGLVLSLFIGIQIYQDLSKVILTESCNHWASMAVKDCK